MDIELVKPEFIVGNEKRFFEFIGNMGKEKIALISHTDLDGITAAKVANSVLEADIVKFVDYEQLNDSLVDELKEEKVKKVVFSDLFIKDKDFVKKLESFADILIIDHHAVEDYNSVKTVYLNAQGFCATYLCYYLFSKIKDLEKLDWLVVYACLSDFLVVKNEAWLRGVYSKYNVHFDTNPNNNSGNVFNELKWKMNLAIVYFKTTNNLQSVFNGIGDKFGDISKIESHVKVIEDEIKQDMKDFERDKKDINGRLFLISRSKYRISSLLINLLAPKFPNNTIIILRPDGEKYTISARNTLGKEDMNLLLQKLIEGFDNSTAGGHIPAAGGHFPKKYLEEFKERLKKI